MNDREPFIAEMKSKPSDARSNGRDCAQEVPGFTKWRVYLSPWSRQDQKWPKKYLNLTSSVHSNLMNGGESSSKQKCLSLCNNFTKHLCLFFNRFLQQTDMINSQLYVNCLLSFSNPISSPVVREYLKANTSERCHHHHHLSNKGFWWLKKATIVSKTRDISYISFRLYERVHETRMNGSDSHRCESEPKPFTPVSWTLSSISYTSYIKICTVAAIQT